MGIRLATASDIDAIYKLAEEVLEKSVYTSKIADMKARQVVARAIYDKWQIVLVAEHKGQVVGFMVGTVLDLWFSRDRYATDLAFYVQSHRGNYAPAMIRHFIRWAKSKKGVVEVTLGISTGLDQDERAGHMYEKLGLKKVGGLYTLAFGESNE